MKSDPMHRVNVRQRTWVAMVMSLALLAPTPVDAQAAIPDSNSITIVRRSARRAELAPAAHFTGSVHVEPLFAATTRSRASGASVTFEAGARAAWHTHPLGQILIVTAGAGRVQRWDGPIDEIRQGDVVRIPPRVKHWHGAAPTAAMTHIAIQEAADGKVVDWLEKVSDAQYTSPITNSTRDRADTAAKQAQAKAPPTQPFGAEAFEASTRTTLRWLGMAGFLINSRGTTLMVDPLLEGFDMPVMITFPIVSRDVPRLDAVLVTHSDNDHYSVPTNRALARVTRVFHSTHYVDTLMRRDGLPSVGHDIGDVFDIGPVRVTVTPADHAWQNAYPGASARRFRNEDSAGFWIETPDGTIWAPGDSRLIPEHHLRMPAPDALLFDFSDSEWHFSLAGAVRMANAYPDTPLVLHHWGSVDAPDFAPFNGNPWTLFGLVKNPGRIRVLAPGEPFTLTRVPKS